MWLTIVMLASIQVAVAELDAETMERLSVIHCPDVETADIVVPIVVSVVDSDGEPIDGVAVGLMRLGDGGFTEVDVLRHSNPRTNSSGVALLSYPGSLSGPALYDIGRASVELIGAITIVHPQFQTVSIELASLYAEPFKVGDPTMAPWVRVTLNRKSETKKAEQGG